MLSEYFSYRLCVLFGFVSYQIDFEAIHFTFNLLSHICHLLFGFYWWGLSLVKTFNAIKYF